MPALRAFLGRHADRVYALMRIVVPFVYACHGAQKLFGVLGGHPVWGGSPLFIAAGLIECICGPLMMLGLFTTQAAFIASGEMAVAYFYMHLPAACGRSKTTASWRRSFRSCFCTWLRADRGSGALTACGERAARLDGPRTGR